ncbi:carbon-nitrogen hydrolase family protein [Amycolatopsis sp.]|uniref:carbon-nitrogen hydrolase family protein n=1 Tax=Amycolatopsis sp. TaxID=37632 RepID=UPI002B97DDB3|nr:carbon-nitrogen hydrolase family protein [Amycolatopsis sp.]HVV08890.1 carbon-nitrogen hydrolase family protein [Amycolatopsis sp.]HVW43445.1 carbon-nitrogen hydrolase family protein [Amycolatopsis sp.]
MRIALGQLAGRPGDLRANLNRAAGLVRDVNTDVLAFPELFACGYDLDAIAADPAWSLTPAALGPLAEAAAETGTWVLLGASVAAEGKPRNAVVVLGPDGTVRGQYDKNHLWGTEKQVFEPGSGLLMLDVAGVSLGLGVCYDAGFPEPARAYARAGAHAVLFCSAFATGPTEHRYRVYHPARALENTIYTLVVNAVGEIAGERYFGESGAWSPSGQRLITAGRGEDVSIVEVSAAEVARTREHLTYLTDLSAGVDHVARIS